MYKPKRFRVEEFVPESVYKARGDKALELMDSRILETADVLKEEFPEGTIIINNWVWGGDRNWSGLRTTDSPYYRPYSQHSFGRALDMIFSAYTAEEVRKYIQLHPEKFPYVTAMELGTSWVHIDCRNCHKLKTFHP